MKRFHRALGGVKGLALTLLVVVPVTAAVVADADHDTPHGSVTAALAHRVTAPAAHREERCHGTGALILRHGRIRQVGLAEGLLTYQHRSPGTFVRLCPGTTAPATPQGS